MFLLHFGKNRTQCQRVIKAGDFDVGKQKVNDIYLHRGTDKFCNTFYGSANLAILSFRYKLSHVKKQLCQQGGPFGKKNPLPLLGGCYLEQQRDNFLSMDCSHNQKQSEGELAIASHRVVST